MAAPMTAAQTRAQMRKWRVPFKEFSGWTTRKRPGTFYPVGLVIHHTGSDSGQNSPSYDNFLFVRGRPEDGIPGPLCQAACEMDGDVILGAIGRANHAGSGSASTLSIVRAGRASRTAEIRPGPDGTNGNGWYYGLEVKFDGGQPMTTRAYDAAVRWAAAYCDFYGWTGGSVIGHKEHSRRKGDPGNTFMAKFRRDVDARLKAGPGGAATTPPVVKPPTTPPLSEELTVAQIDTIMNKLNKIDTDAGNRYSDLAGRIQRLTNAQAGRYSDFVGRFDAVLREVAADDANDVTDADVDRILAKLNETHPTV